MLLGYIKAGVTVSYWVRSNLTYWPSNGRTKAPNPFICFHVFIIVSRLALTALINFSWWYEYCISISSSSCHGRPCDKQPSVPTQKKKKKTIKMIPPSLHNSQIQISVSLLQWWWKREKLNKAKQLNRKSQTVAGRQVDRQRLTQTCWRAAKKNERGT